MIYDIMEHLDNYNTLYIPTWFVLLCLRWDVCIHLFACKGARFLRLTSEQMLLQGHLNKYITWLEYLTMKEPKNAEGKCSTINESNTGSGKEIKTIMLAVKLKQWSFSLRSLMCFKSIMWWLLESDSRVHKYERSLQKICLDWVANLLLKFNGKMSSIA